MIEKERARRIYQNMNRIRCFEMKAVSLFESNKLRGSVHLYVGEEAVAATVCSHLSDEDYIASTHRGHGHCIAKGATLDGAMAELMGKATGYCKGRSGSMHIADLSKGNLGANAIVGGGIPIATGAALASKMQNNGRVSVSFFGDGASNEGTFHESLNLAAVWKLPIIFVCENNLYGISVPAWQSTSVKDISVRGAAYGIPGVTVDGNDVEAIDEAFHTAYERARSGEGPTLIECKTYRWLGHWTGDPQPYRTREEVEEWKQKCPIKRYRSKLLEEGLFTAEELEQIEKSAQEEADRAAEFALSSPDPDPASLLDDVFYEGGDAQ
ncbi:thiamine pyrophosphate-dependent dehydrogenase E1 component subunit alpha [bacterium 1XD21-13]|nr:thiamine pyrophosphate-dependent dehydrogenase E1 component subunit alpha [bacterium 1XD21-13]